MSATLAVCFTFVGCCINLIFLELLVKEDPGSGNLITFSQFLLISIEGFIFTTKCGTKKSDIGIKDYIQLVIMFFLCNVCNNYAFDFNVPMPLHMIFRAGSLITNMIMCIIILKTSYPLSKYISVTMITIGIIICTIISGQNIKSTQVLKPGDTQPTSWDDVFWWCIGILLLTVALLISARMGIDQQLLHQRHGKRPREALFYTHCLSLPFFLIFGQNIWNHFKLALASPPMSIPILGVTLPKNIGYLIGNILAQYVCISSVYKLTSECTSLTVTLVVTLRKFISLIFSIFYFQNPFTMYHWIGTFLVFTGTAIFTEITPKIYNGISQLFTKTKKL